MIKIEILSSSTFESLSEYILEGERCYEERELDNLCSKRLLHRKLPQAPSERLHKCKAFVLALKDSLMSFRRFGVAAGKFELIWDILMVNGGFVTP